MVSGKAVFIKLHIQTWLFPDSRNGGYPIAIKW
jgi:hypothetical protein